MADKNDDTSGDANNDTTSGEVVKTVSAEAFAAVKNEKKALQIKLGELEKADQDRRTAEMSEVERLKVEVNKRDEEIRLRDERLQAREVSDLKRQAFQKAKVALGEGFYIEPESEQKLLAKLEKINYDPENYEQDIEDLIQIAKKPVKNSSKGNSGMNLGSNAPQAKDPLDYSAKELKALERDDPDKVAEIMEQRKEARRKK